MTLAESRWLRRLEKGIHFSTATDAGQRRVAGSRNMAALEVDKPNAGITNASSRHPAGVNRWTCHSPGATPSKSGRPLRPGQPTPKPPQPQAPWQQPHPGRPPASSPDPSAPQGQAGEEHLRPTRAQVVPKRRWLAVPPIGGWRTPDCCRTKSQGNAGCTSLAAASAGICPNPASPITLRTTRRAR